MLLLNRLKMKKKNLKFPPSCQLTGLFGRGELKRKAQECLRRLLQFTLDVY